MSKIREQIGASSLLGALAINKAVRNPIKKLSGKKTYTPWMHKIEFAIIMFILKEIKPKNCLEWGCGYSTLYFPDFISKRSKWSSVEHDRQWGNEIKKLNERKNVVIKLIEPEQFPWTDKNEDGAYEDLAEYIEYPKKKAPYDFILVDGRARAECLKKAYEWVSDNGVVVLHDAKRTYYHKPLKQFAYGKFLDVGKETLWVGSKRKDFGKVYNVGKYEKLWHIYRDINYMRDGKWEKIKK